MKEKKFHPTEIPGYEGDEGKCRLADIMAGLRYDEQAKLVKYYEEATLRRAQKDEDQLRRTSLAWDGRILAGQIKSVFAYLKHMFNRYRKHMEHELGKSEECL